MPYLSGRFDVVRRRTFAQRPVTVLAADVPVSRVAARLLKGFQEFRLPDCTRPAPGWVAIESLVHQCGVDPFGKRLLQPSGTFEIKWPLQLIQMMMR